MPEQEGQSGSPVRARAHAEAVSAYNQSSRQFQEHQQWLPLPRSDVVPGPSQLHPPQLHTVFTNSGLHPSGALH